jgi:hypothetical protein
MPCNQMPHKAVAGYGCFPLPQLGLLPPIADCKLRVTGATVNRNRLVCRLRGSVKQEPASPQHTVLRLGTVRPPELTGTLSLLDAGGGRGHQ